MDSLLRQPHLPHQLSKAWIGTQGVKQEISLQTQHPHISLPIGDVEPPECLIFVSQIGMEGCDIVRRKIASLTLRLTALNRSPESALPACRTKPLLHARGEIGFVLVIGKSTVGLPFLDDLRVHPFSPI